MSWLELVSFARFLTNETTRIIWMRLSVSDKVTYEGMVILFFYVRLV